MSSSSAGGPLAGVRVVDMTMEVIGPLAAQSMAALGAEVIKIEPPGGDGRRTQGPARHRGMTSQFLHTNRGKRSVVVNLKNPRGRDVVLRLCRKADVFLYNSRRQAMRRLGLAWEDVSAVNRRIVYCGASGFGEDGRYGRKPAYDEVIQGLTAIPMLQQQLTGSAPTFLPFMFADRIGGLALTQTVLAALVARDRTGEGQAVELPMFETLAAFVLSEHQWGRTFDPPVGGTGMQRMFTRRPAATKDGWLCYTLASDEQVARFCDIAGVPEHKSDERFARRADRNRNIGEFYRFVEGELAKRTTAEWLDLFRKADLPAAPVRSLEELMEDPHLRATGFFSTVAHPSEGDIVVMGPATRWSATSPDTLRHAPRLGEHTVEVLAEAGYSEAEIADLLASGAVAQAGAPAARSWSDTEKVAGREKGATC